MATAQSRPTISTITISTSEGAEEIAAQIFGPLACHQGIGLREGWWVVTHVASGLALASCGVFRSEHEAVNAMMDVASKGDWSDLSDEGLQRLGRMVRPAFARHGAEVV